MSRRFVASRVESAFTPTTYTTTTSATAPSTTPTATHSTTTREGGGGGGGSAAVEYYDCIVLALPAFAHDTYLNAMAPYLGRHPSRPPTLLVAAVAQGGGLTRGI